jgi:hypothetical protein
MTVSIENIVRKFLNEVKTQQKSEFNRGMEHRIYASKYSPDRLFKVGDEGVLHWVKVFRSNPNIFAEVFRTGKINDSEVRGTYYAEIEKLQTDRVLSEWQQIEDKLEEIGVIDSEDESFGRDITDIYTNHGHDQKTISEIANKLNDYDKDAYNLFIKYFKLFKDCEKAIEKVVGHETLVDAHRYNFGYSSDGRLKCLDI